MKNLNILPPIKLILMTGILWIGFSANPDTNGFPQFSSNVEAAAGGNGGGNSGDGAGNGRGQTDRDSNPGQTASADAKAQKDDNLHSELGALNSLVRNIQGMINGNDAKVEEFRVRNEEGEVTGITNSDGDWSEAVSSWIGDRVTSLTTAFDDLDEPENHETDSE